MLIRMNVLYLSIFQLLVWMMLNASGFVTSSAITQSRRISSLSSPSQLYSSSKTNTDETRIAKADDIISYAERNGVVLSLSTLGPGYRSVARAKHDDKVIIGYCEGFLRPGSNILHLDSMQVFKKSLVKCREENPDEFTGGGTVFGVGLLLGCLCLAHGLENGCSKAEFLAIDDEERQHKRLVRYYKRLGLNVVRYVGDDIKSIPDRLVWGGAGTLMSESIVTLLERWSPIFIAENLDSER